MLNTAIRLLNSYLGNCNNFRFLDYSVKIFIKILTKGTLSFLINFNLKTIETDKSIVDQDPQQNKTKKKDKSSSREKILLYEQNELTEVYHTEK